MPGSGSGELIVVTPILSLGLFGGVDMVDGQERLYASSSDMSVFCGQRVMFVIAY